MMSLTFGLFTQVSGSGPLGPLVWSFLLNCEFNINVFTQILLLFHLYDAQASSTCSALILSGAAIKLGK